MRTDMDFPAPPIPLERTPEGIIRISGMRITLDSAVYHFRLGATPEAILQKYPSLTLPVVYAVIAYYLQNRTLIDGYLAESEQAQDQLDNHIDTSYPQAGIRERLLARGFGDPTEIGDHSKRIPLQ